MLEIQLNQKINDIHQFIATKLSPNKFTPSVGIILGSGLGEFAAEINEALVIPYAEIPHLPDATAPGHSGNLIFGKVGDKNIVAMQGRLHLYEGNSPQMATILIRVMKLLGVKTLLISCAAGGLNREFNAGELMLISDHINLTGQSPLTGTNLVEFGPRFPGMFDIYDKQSANLAQQIALKQQTKLHSGVYVGYAGPQYCTRAELNYFAIIGGDAVGMSVVSETITASHCGLKIIGIAAITDMALPYAEHHADEQQVIKMGQKIGAKFKLLVTELIKLI